MPTKRLTSKDVWDILSQLSERERKRFCVEFLRKEGAVSAQDCEELRRSAEAMASKSEELASSAERLAALCDEQVGSANEIAAVHRAIKERLPELERVFRTAMDGMLALTTEYIARRNTSARNAERDAEIVRLRDEKHLSFGQICNAIRKRWPTTERGKPITPNAVGVAYRNAKDRGVTGTK
jgi:hypothetical protein